VGLEQFGRERFARDGVTDACLAELLPRVNVRVASDITARYPAEWGTRVTFVHADGERIVREAAFPRGNPENPVGTATLEDKLRALVAPRHGEETAERAIALVHALDEVSDVAPCVADLAPARAR
jgi:2-methylcitrate dehydratase PrpD